MRQRAHQAIIIAAVSTLLFTACAAEPSPSPSSQAGAQTLVDACAVVRDGVANAASELQRLDLEDPGAAVTAFSAIAADLSDAASKIDNKELTALLPRLQSGFADAADALQAVTSGNLARLPDLQTAAAGIQTQLTQFASLCGAP